MKGPLRYVAFVVYVSLVHDPFLQRGAAQEAVPKPKLTAVIPSAPLIGPNQGLPRYLRRILRTS